MISSVSLVIKLSLYCFKHRFVTYRANCLFQKEMPEPNTSAATQLSYSNILSFHHVTRYFLKFHLRKSCFVTDIATEDVNLQQLFAERACVSSLVILLSFMQPAPKCWGRVSSRLFEQYNCYIVRRLNLEALCISMITEI